MFRTLIGKRTARGMAVGALILSISATTFGGSANAAPSADDTKSCSTLAHERNDAVHTLHAAWKDFRDELKDLARDARELARDARHSKSATELTGDARKEVADARAKLMEIWTSAHEELQNRVDLGQACEDADTEEDEADTSTSTTTTNETTTTTSGTDVSTEDLVAKYKEVVDQAIADMQTVLDDVTAAVAKITTAAQSTDDSLAAKVKAERAKEKDAREHGNSNRSGHGNGKGSRG